MLEKLTAEQEAKMPQYVEQYTALGLSTSPFTDESKQQIVKALEKAYKAADLDAPEHVLFCLSPMQALEQACKIDKYGDPNSLEPVTAEDLKNHQGNFIFGSQDAGWLSFYNFFKNECAISGLEGIEGLTELLGLCSFVLPYENVCIVSQNLSKICMVGGRLHNLEGPAWSYEDGFAGYSLDGVAVPKEVIDTLQGKLPPETILKLTNAEQRMVGIKYLGPEFLLKAFGGKELDQRGDMQVDGRPEYVLHEVKIEGSFEKLLEMQNPSEPKRHYEFVPPEIKNCSQALAWRLGWEFDSKFVAPKAKS